VPRTEILVDSCLELVDGEAPPLLRGFARPLDGNITAPHAVLVTQLCAHVARSLDWDEENFRDLVLAGFLHDIGMVFVEDKALWSSRPLSEKVRKKIQSHTRIGCALIAGTGEWSPVVSNAARDHHERWNGSGYPCGNKGTETGFQARLLGLLDTYAALVTPRPHRSALDPAFARERLDHAMRLGLFDPSLRAILEETLGNLPFQVAEPRGAEPRPPLTRNSIELRGELVTMLAKGST
jgi:HD-GYP domain-containing protein (c-di-GMP phosphodiesterase class II)